MKAPVVKAPWFKDGLRFQCSGCGNCCTGGPGYIWINDDELTRLAEFLKLSVSEVRRRYCHKIDGRVSLKEKPRNARGEYDCIFLKELAAQPCDVEAGGRGKRICEVYAVRPLQCRTWPFWEGNLASPAGWLLAGKRCPGVNGGREWDAKDIVKRRDADDWPTE